MDKTLEIIMVAMTLIVAAVVVISMLQGQTRDYGEFSDQRTNSSDCTFGELQYRRNLECSNSQPDKGPAEDIQTEYSSCSWASAATDGSSYCP